GFTSSICFLSTLAFAILPAVKGSQGSTTPGLSTRISAGDGNRWRHAMIAIEGALSVFLLCSVGLIAQNLWALITHPMGFDPSHVVVMRMKLAGQRADAVNRKAGDIFQDYLDKIATIPGVEAAATVTGPPLLLTRSGNFELEGMTEPNGELKVVWAQNDLV